MIILNAQQTEAALDYPGLIEALRQAHASGKRPQSDTTVLQDRKSADNQFVSLVAWLEGRRLPSSWSVFSLRMSNFLWPNLRSRAR